MKLADDFRQSLLRGNVMDLAVAVVIGAAFGAIVTAFVSDLLTTLIAAIAGQTDFSALEFTVNNSVFRYGHSINTVVSFIIVASVVFFVIVKPMNALIARSKKEAPVDSGLRKCPECLSSILKDAHRCAFCTVELDVVPDKV